mmetsp:Transcript_45042/g.131150  ORF Transcript_45042/g.131150 Transcript_45042/m.131150 type:complete len:222 (+) Transcript_45042:550-1215(+)
MPGTRALPIFAAGASESELELTSYWPGPGKQSRLKFRPREPLLASAFTFRAFRWSKSCSLRANNVSTRSTLLSTWSFNSMRLCSSTRFKRLLFSRTSMMCRCCSSLRSILFCCSSSRRASTCAIFSPSLMSFSSPSRRFSTSRCSLFRFIASTLSLKICALSLDSCARASWKRIIRSSSASKDILNFSSFSRKSSFNLATSSPLRPSLASVFSFTFCAASA